MMWQLLQKKLCEVSSTLPTPMTTDPTVIAIVHRFHPRSPSLLRTRMIMVSSHGPSPAHARDPRARQP